MQAHSDIKLELSTAAEQKQWEALGWAPISLQWVPRGALRKTEDGSILLLAEKPRNTEYRNALEAERDEIGTTLHMKPVLEDSAGNVRVVLNVLAKPWAKAEQAAAHFCVKYADLIKSHRKNLCALHPVFRFDRDTLSNWRHRDAKQTMRSDGTKLYAPAAAAAALPS